MSSRFENMNVLITGAGSGIGKELAGSFVEEGARVLLCDQASANLTKLADAIGEQALPVEMNVSSLSDWNRTLKTAHELFGRIQILINAAGITDRTPFDYLTEEAFRKSMEINLMSVFYSFKTVVEDMKEQKWGRIINISSILGLRGNGDYAANVASSHAVTGMTRAAGYSFAKYNILTNSIHTGTVDSPMIEHLKDLYPQAVSRITDSIPLGRMSTPEDLTGLVTFLCSEENTFINGAGIVIDGGQFA